MSMNLLKSLGLRRDAGLTKDGQIMARNGFVAGGEGKPVIVFPGADTVALFDDFLGDLVADELIAGSSDTGQATNTGVLGTSAVSATNGIYRMTSSATSTQTPDGGAQSINGAPNWKANQGRLRYGTRLKIATLAGNSIFAGLTDTGGTEMAAYDTGGGIITPAADYAGFICSGEGGATQQAWRLVAGKAGVDQSATTGVTPVANTYNTLEVEVSADGNVVNGFIDGKAVAQITSAGVTPTVALAGGVWRVNTDAAANAVDVDYLNISAARDTGL